MLKRFIKNNEGATSIEYVLIGVAMAICLILIMPMITDALNTEAVNISSRITAYK